MVALMKQNIQVAFLFRMGKSRCYIEDVYVEDDQNTVFNLEMQTSDNRNLPKRMRYYQGVIDLNILQKGQDYTKLKKSYVIFICTFDPFGEGRHIYTFCNTCQENTALLRQWD